VNYQYRIHEIRLDLGESKDRIPKKILRKLGKAGKKVKISDWIIRRESIDARHKDRIKMVYTVDFTVDRELNLAKAPDLKYHRAVSGTQPLKHRPVVVGMGPCGMFAALILAQQGYCPLVIERGAPVEERVRDVQKFWDQGVLDPESNVQFGEGGAGTFSDGKLTTGIKDPRIHFMLEEFVKAGADPEILYAHMPHIGTDVLRICVKNIREQILSLGGEIHFHSRMDQLIMEQEEDGFRVSGIQVTENGVQKTIEADQVILALGHSARDTFRMLRDHRVPMEQKGFSIGVRIEHPQEVIDRAQYGDTGKNLGLPPAVYKLNWHCRKSGRGVYTFCMCPGGEVITASSQKGGVVTNGMSRHGRDSGTANSALLVDVRPLDFPDPDDPLSGIDFQEKYERLAFKNGGSDYSAPKTSWKNFRDKTEDAQPVLRSLPDFAVDSIDEAMPHLGKKLQGFDSDDAVMTAVESRSSSPVRILRDENQQSLSVRGLYPGGEGAGYAGGITSSACDGMKIAEQIISSFTPWKKFPEKG
jgi:uncharacterized FAD-dependent dehydrogenase